MANDLVNFDEYSSDFTWDKALHFPIPTDIYILNRTGIDINARHETTSEAKGTILAITRTARNYAYRMKSEQDRNGTTWCLAHNYDLIEKILEYILEFVNIFYTSGSYLDLLNVGQKVVIPAIDNALSNTGLSYNYSVHAYKYDLDHTDY